MRRRGKNKAGAQHVEPRVSICHKNPAREPQMAALTNRSYWRGLPISLQVISKLLEFGRFLPWRAWFPGLQSWVRVSLTFSRVSILPGRDWNTPKSASVFHLKDQRSSRLTGCSSFGQSSQGLPGLSESWHPAGMESQSTALIALLPWAPARHMTQEVVP